MKLLFKLSMFLQVILLTFSVSAAQDITWNFEDDLSDWTAAGGTAEQSDEWFFSGSNSAKLTSSNNSPVTIFRNNSFNDLSAGDTLSVRVFAESFGDINTLYLFAEANGGEITSQDYVPNNNILPGQWTTISLTVPLSAQNLNGFGLQFTSEVTSTPSIFLDDYTVRSYAPVVIDSVYNAYDFEDETLGDWTINNSNGIATIASDMSFSGLNSVEIDLNSGILSEFVNFSPAPYAPGQIISFHVWVPADTSNLEALSPYIQYDEIPDDDNEWDGWAAAWYTPTDLETSAWNEISVEMPAYQSIQSVGLQLRAKSEAASPSYFVDLISSDPDSFELPTVAIPSGLAEDSVSATYAAFSWTASEGNNFSHYTIWRGGGTEELAPIDTTSATNYKDTALLSDTGYEYSITASDTFGRTTETSQSLFVETEAFENLYTWDFEQGLENWTTGNNSGVLSLVDSLSYSGMQSVKLTMRPDTNQADLVLDNTDIEAGQTIRFKFYTPGDLSNVEAFQPFVQYNDWTGYTGNYVSAGEFEAEQWNELSIQIPEYENLNRIGFKVISSTQGAPPVLVDLVTTDPKEEGIPTVTAPSGLKASNITETSTELLWDASTGNGFAGYKIYRALTNWNVANAEILDTVMTTSFADEDLSPGLPYVYVVTAIDRTGHETQGTETIITTADFDTHATFDFEQNLEGWTTAQGAAERTDERSYSGIYSIKFETGGQESFFELIDDNTAAPGTPEVNDQVLTGHTLTYRVWIAKEDTSKIDLFQIWAKDGTWNWSSAVVNIDEIIPDTWNEMSYTIPDTTSNLNSVGFQIIGRESGTNPEVIVYIDLVSTEANPVVRPHLTIPANLTGTGGDDRYTISWTGSAGNDELQFYRIYRRELPSEENEFIEAGTTAETQFTEENMTFGTSHEIKVVAVDTEDRESFASNTIQVAIGGLNTETGTGSPQIFALYDNYPNPFNPTTQITYDVPYASDIKLQVFDIAGRLVQTLVNEHRIAGSYTVSFRGDQLASGVYFYRMEAGSFIQMNRMVLIK